MISKEIIEKTKEFAYFQTEKYLTPLMIHIEIANKKGQELSEKLGSNKDIVLLGTLLMDCMLGIAVKEGKKEKHIEMSAEKAKEFLSQFTEMTAEEKNNVVHCVEQHHGVEKFYSIEAEICCNADCYRFLSAKGIIGGIRHFRDMELAKLVKLFICKAEEKWNVLSLDICKKELKPQYKAIKEFLSKF